jgi:hypothetical protein
MKSGSFGWMLASGAFVAVLLPRVAAGVNCDQVRRYLQTGRSAQDVAETMIISVDDVKKCQESAPAAQKGQQAPAPTPPAPQAPK